MLSLDRQSFAVTTKLPPGWAGGLERRTGDRVVQGSNLGDAALLQNFANSVYRTLLASFGGDTF